jgi:hypothetical protein
MVRLRNALMAVILATGVIGCSHGHWSIFRCSECDDFPMPSYGPGYSMMPGSYAGPPPQSAPSASRTMIPPSSNLSPSTGEPPAATTPPATTPPATSAPTPPAPPAATNPNP